MSVATVTTAFATVHLETHGFLSFEAESTQSPLTKWTLVSPSSPIYVPGASGDAHLEFTGNNQASGPPSSPLVYRFKITNGGTYQMVIRSRQRLEGATSDRSNDCYVRMDGDFDSLPAHDIEESLRVDTKFGGIHIKPDTWGYSSILFELPGAQSARKAFYIFKSGETYTLTISGRSRNYNIDRITFFDWKAYNEAFAAEELIPGGIPPFLSKYQDWADGYPDLGDENGLADDPDGDNRSNLYEYALGLDPTIQEEVSFPLVEFIPEPGNPYLRCSYLRLDDPASRGLTYAIQTRPTLSGESVWQTLDPSGETIHSHPVIGYSFVENRIPISEGKKEFLRLKIDLQP